MKDADAAPQRRLPVSEYVISESETRRESVLRRLEEWIAESDGRIVDASQVGVLTVDLGGRGHHFITQAEVESQAGRQFEIVLNETAEERLSVASHEVRVGIRSLQIPHPEGQQVGY